MYLFSFWDVGAYAAVYVTLKLENCWQIFKNIHYIYVAWINFYMQIISSIDNIYAWINFYMRIISSIDNIYACEHNKYVAWINFYMQILSNIDSIHIHELIICAVWINCCKWMISHIDDIYVYAVSCLCDGLELFSGTELGSIISWIAMRW